MKKLLTGISLVAAGLFSLPASAGLIPVTSDAISGSDCAGYFGGSFDSCQIFAMDNGTEVELSPVIAKYGFDDNGDIEETEINDSLFDSFKGSEITFNMGTQTWDYTTGENDPGIRYVAAKGGTFFNLRWYVDETDYVSFCESALSLGCLDAAVAMEEGTWTVPGTAGLSHLTFYDSVPPQVVPEPGTLALLGLGLAGLGAARRRQKA